jgi:hypothetical protein
MYEVACIKGGMHGMSNFSTIGNELSFDVNPITPLHLRKVRRNNGS